VRQVLEKARTLLTDSARWTRDAPARNQDGTPVRPSDPSAICWCLEAAIGIAAGRSGIVPFEMLELLDRAAVDLYAAELRIEHVNFDTGDPEPPLWDYVAYESSSYVNDVLGHEATLAVLDRAIELAGTR